MDIFFFFLENVKMLNVCLCTMSKWQKAEGCAKMVSYNHAFQRKCDTKYELNTGVVSRLATWPPSDLASTRSLFWSLCMSVKWVIVRLHGTIMNFWLCPLSTLLPYHGHAILYGVWMTKEKKKCTQKVQRWSQTGWYTTLKTN